MKKRLQNKIASSTLTLPTTAVIVTLLWWLPQGGYSPEYLLGWSFCALTTFVVLRTAAQNVLLRVRSRMISSLLLLYMGVCGFLHPLQTGTVLQFILACSLFFYLRTSERQRPESDTFQAYLLFSLGSLFWAPVLLLTPVMMWSQGLYLRSLQRRSFGAALLGVLTPYFLWWVAAFSLDTLSLSAFLPLPAIWQDTCHMQTFVTHLTEIIAPFTEPFSWQWIVDDAHNMDGATFWPILISGLQERLLSHLSEVVAFLLIALSSLTGFIHYVRQSYDDKTRVRMCHYSYLSLLLVLLCWSVLVPAHLPLLFPMLILVCVPSAAHFIALTRTWLTNMWCLALFLLSLVVAYFQLSPPLLFQ